MNTAQGHRSRVLGPLLLTGLGLAAIVPHDAAAHFVLEEPESWRVQSGLGDPQKLGPCGDEGSAAETGAITAYQTGQTITITLRETIFHPGHFRVALAVDDRSELPPVPPVTPDSSSDCGSVPIMDPPVFPVLADGMLLHTSPLSGEQTLEVTLPAGVTCDHCTLQVVQWMSDHSAPCFYYHCGDISISDVVVDGGTPVDADLPAVDGSAATDSSTPSVDTGTRADSGGTTTPPAASCGCSVPGRAASDGGATPIAALALVALGAVVVRRRRR